MRRLLLIGVPLLITAGAALGVALVAGFSDPATRWTAIAAIVAGAALVAGVIGVPLALLSVFNIQDELARLNVRSETITELRREAAIGIGIQLRWQQFGPDGQAFEKWREETEEAILHLTGEEAFQLAFRASGYGKPGVDDLGSKVDYLLNYLIPAL